MQLTNLQIEQYATNYKKEFADFKSYIPAKVSFYLIKNINLLFAAADEIQKSKLEIAKHYGELDKETGNYIIPQEVMPIAAKELEDLYNIEQDLNIKTFSIESLNNVEFTPAQMNAILFMIEE